MRSLRYSYVERADVVILRNVWNVRNVFVKRLWISLIFVQIGLKMLYVTGISRYHCTSVIRIKSIILSARGRDRGRGGSCWGGGRWTWLVIIDVKSSMFVPMYSPRSWRGRGRSGGRRRRGGGSAWGGVWSGMCGWSFILRINYLRSPSPKSWTQRTTSMRMSMMVREFEFSFPIIRLLFLKISEHIEYNFDLNFLVHQCRYFHDG